MTWNPVKTAPANTRLLVHDEQGRVQIARLATLRWRDDSDRLIDPPIKWMPLPEVEEPPPAAMPKPKPRSRKRR